MPLRKLAVVTTHPIQYYAPLFELLHKRGNIEVMVFYTMGGQAGIHYDSGFGKNINWDIPLTEGYRLEWLKNISREPGSHHFYGIVNPDIEERIKEYSPDAVLIYGWAYSGHLKALRYFKGRIPVYFRGDSTVLNKAGILKEILKTIWLKWVYKHVDHAFYVGLNNKSYFRRYGLKEAQLSFAPHAVDNERFGAPRPAEARELRLSLNIPDQAALILYAGKFDQVKNVTLLLTAFILLNNKKVHLLLAGNGVEENRLKQAAAESPVHNNIHFISFRNQRAMPALYQAADIVCLPSLSETWGLAINEAMACKKAVLVSDKVGCAADLVRPGMNGYIFKSNDTGDLLFYLRKFANAPSQEIKAFGDCSGLVIKDWDFIQIAEAIEKKMIL